LPWDAHLDVDLDVGPDVDVDLGLNGRPSPSPGWFSTYIPCVPIYRLPREPVFPDPARAEPDGLLAVGGDLSPERLLSAYAEGIFPWYGDDSPILWWSPDPRLVLEPAHLHVPRSLQKAIRQGRYRVSADEAFERVIARCAEQVRPGQEGTWITEEMLRAYVRLHQLGFAHSFEAWQGKDLAGGLYGVSLGAAFFGESMYADRPDASKVAFVRAVAWLATRDVNLVDCQVRTEHLVRFGAHEVSRGVFLRRLAAALREPTRRGRWMLDGGA
jgi:leucyl/phenylalanyl-tRNA--protein transferase